MNEERKPDEALLNQAVQALQRGELIGLPTETVYGLAADAANPDAIAAIYRIKGRPTDHPLIVHVPDSAEAARWGVWNQAAERLAAAFWPGPLTLVLMRDPRASAFACAGHPTIGLRVPSHPVALALLRRLQAVGIGGLAAPSANRFGRVSPTSAAHVRADLGDEVRIVLDGGDAQVGIESTIVDLSGTHPAVLRPGQVSAAQIARVLGCEPGDLDSTGQDSPARLQDQRPQVPGSHRSHYAPVTPLRLVGAGELAAAIASADAVGSQVAVWSVEEPVSEVLRWLRRPRSIDAIGHSLYAALRELDAAGADLILVERPAGVDGDLRGIDPAWEGVADRLRRAVAAFE